VRKNKPVAWVGEDGRATLGMTKKLWNRNSGKEVGQQERSRGGRAESFGSGEEQLDDQLFIGGQRGVRKKGCKPTRGGGKM